jgi:hypothetical protein
MPIGGEVAVVRISGIIYRRMLLFYPPELRYKFSEEMQDTFVALLGDAIVERRAADVFGLWRLALSELLTVALPLRLASEPVMAGALSFVASAALFLVFFRAVS